MSNFKTVSTIPVPETIDFEPRAWETYNFSFLQRMSPELLDDLIQLRIPAFERRGTHYLKAEAVGDESNGVFFKIQFVPPQSQSGPSVEPVKVQSSAWWASSERGVVILTSEIRETLREQIDYSFANEPGAGNLEALRLDRATEPNGEV